MPMICANIDWAWRIRAMTVAAGGASPTTMGGGSLPRVKLTYRDLFHMSGIGTPVGILFWVVLMAVQFARRLGLQDRIAARLDRTQADLWVVPFGIKSFDDRSLLPGHEKRAILSAPGVAGMEDLAVGFVAGRKLSDGATAALLVGLGRAPQQIAPLGFHCGQPHRADLAHRRGRRCDTLGNWASRIGATALRPTTCRWRHGSPPKASAPSRRCLTCSQPSAWSASCCAMQHQRSTAMSLPRC